MLVTLDTIMEIYETLTKNVTKKDPHEGVNDISHSTYCAAIQSYCLVRKCWFLPQQENQLLLISSK